jgi:DNA-binding HxlR family transcriptional regulator
LKVNVTDNSEWRAQGNASTRYRTGARNVLGDIATPSSPDIREEPFPRSIGDFGVTIMPTQPSASPKIPQGCPLDALLKALSRAWLAHVVWAIGHAETLQFGQLRRAMPAPVSARVMTARLRELEQAGIIARTENPGRVATVSYTLTEKGLALHRVLLAMSLEAEAAGITAF